MRMRVSDTVPIGARASSEAPVVDSALQRTRRISMAISAFESLFRPHYAKSFPIHSRWRLPSGPHAEFGRNRFEASGQARLGNADVRTMTLGGQVFDSPSAIGHARARDRVRSSGCAVEVAARRDM